MALFIRQDEERSELQKKVASQIQNRLKDQEKEYSDNPDGIEDSRYIENTKATTSLAWLWLSIVIALTAVVIWLTVISLSR